MSQHFGTRNCGLPKRWFVQGVRVPKFWDTELRWQGSCRHPVCDGTIIRSLMSHSNEIINTIVGIVRPGEWPKDQYIFTTRRILRQQIVNAISPDYQCKRRPQHSHCPHEYIIVKRHYRSLQIDGTNTSNSGLPSRDYRQTSRCSRSLDSGQLGLCCSN